MRALNFVKFATSTTGTSDIAVGSADTGFITPAQAGIANGDRVPYVIDDATDWAFGVGVYSTTGPTLARDASETRIVSGTKSVAKLSLSGSAKVYFDIGEGIAMTRPDVLSQASASSIAPDLNNYSTFRFTALAANLPINPHVGTPHDGQRIQFIFYDNGTARALTWNGLYQAPVGSALPEATEPGKEFRCEFEWTAARNRWRLISSSKMVRNVRRIGAFSFKSSSTSSDTNVDLSTLFAGDPLQENDFVYVFVASCGTSDRNVAINTAGWTEAAEQYQNDVRDVNAALYYKKMTSTPDTTVQVDNFGSSSEPLAGIVVAYRDVNTTTQRDVAGTNTGGLNTGDATPPAITPTTVGAKVAVFAAGTVFFTFIANFTPPSDVAGIVVDSQAASSGSNAICVGFGEADWESGTFTPLLWDGPGSTDDSWAAFTEAVRPA